MPHVIQLALGAFRSSLGVEGSTKSWEASLHDQQIWENESIGIGISQRLRNEGHPGINKVSAIWPGLGKIIEMVRFSRYFGCPETDLHTAENTCSIDYADTWLSKRLHLLSKSQTPNRGTSDYGCWNMMEFQTAVTWAGLPIAGIHRWVSSKSKIPLLPATVHNTRWMDNWKVCHGSIEAIPILDPVDVEAAYSHIQSHYHCAQ